MYFWTRKTLRQTTNTILMRRRILVCDMRRRINV